MTVQKLVSCGFALLTILFSTSVLPSAAEPVCNVDSALADKLQLPVYEWIDTTVQPKGIIVAVHGLTFYAAAYDKLARHLAANGYAVYAADLRGFGRWKTEAKKFGGDDQIHFTQSKDDLLRIVTELRSQHPDQQIICLGESLGANYALWALSEEQGQMFDAGVIFAPGVKTRIHPHPRMAIDFFRGLRHPNKRLNLEPYITPYLSNDKVLTAACLHDRAICRDLSPVELIKAHITNRRAIEHVNRIPATTPIMLVAGENDQVFKSAALPEFAKKLGSHQVSITTLSGKGHLLLENQEVDARIQDALDTWLQTREPSAVQATTNSSLHARFTERLPAWLDAAKKYSPMAMARASLQHARQWTHPTSQ